MTMEILNILPGHYVEHEFFGKIFHLLDRTLFENVTVIATDNYKILPRYGQNVIVLLTAGDEKGGLPEYFREVRYVFKHHLDYEHIENVWHLPLPYVNGFNGTPKLPMEKRTTDVLFAGRSSRREDMLAAVERLQDHRPDLKVICYITGKKFMKGWPIGTYSQAMENAKIVLSPQGAVRAECIRFTEAVKCGSAIIACRHPRLCCFDQTPATYLDRWGTLEAAVDALLAPGKLSAVQAGMRLAWDRFFSPEAQASKINTLMRDGRWESVAPTLT